MLFWECLAGGRCALPMRHCHLSSKRATYPSDALTDRLTVLLNEMDTKSRLSAFQNRSLSRFHHHLIHLLSNSPLKATCYPGVRYKGDWHSARCSGLPPSGLVYKSFFPHICQAGATGACCMGCFLKTSKCCCCLYGGYTLRLMAFKKSMHLLYPL